MSECKHLDLGSCWNDAECFCPTCLEVVFVRKRHLDKAQNRIKALEGVVEATKVYSKFRRVGHKGHKSKLIIMAKETDLFDEMVLALDKLGEV
jgi:hypothetical protein